MLQKPESPKIALELEGVSVSYGAIEAVRDVSFRVPERSIVSLIGANGAGKSTILRAISGLVKPTKGRILHRGEDLTKLPAHKIVARKISQAPEGRGIFLNLSVWENLDLGAWSVADKSLFAADLERVFTLFPRLKERQKQNAGTLSGGEQQMLAIGRALLSHPEILLLDEPSLGLAPQIIERIFEIIQEIHRGGTTVLLVEQNALQALQIASLGIVIETGNIVLQGPAHELLASPKIREAYLGECR